MYFAPQSSKDWTKGHRFIEWVAAATGSANGLQVGERWVLGGLSAIRGSRNGVFWSNAIAIVIWRERAIAFLQHEQKLADAKNEKEGGLTRRYLLAMLQEPEVIACLHAMALTYLLLYLPFMSAVTHVNDVADELSALDQSVYASLSGASDEVEAGELIDGRRDRLLLARYDRVQLTTLNQRKTIRTLIAALPSSMQLRVEELFVIMMEAGAKSFHHHTVERQLVQHDAEKPDKRLGTLLNLEHYEKQKLRAGRALTHAQERMFGVLRLEHERALTLLHEHLEGRVRLKLDTPDVWLFNLVASGGLAEAQLDALVRFGGDTRRCYIDLDEFLRDQGRLFTVRQRSAARILPSRSRTSPSFSAHVRCMFFRSKLESVIIMLTPFKGPAGRWRRGGPARRLVLRGSGAWRMASWFAVRAFLNTPCLLCEGWTVTKKAGLRPAGLRPRTPKSAALCFS